MLLKGAHCYDSIRESASLRICSDLSIGCMGQTHKPDTLLVSLASNSQLYSFSSRHAALMLHCVGSV